MEDRCVGRVELVGAEGAADRDDVHRQLTCQQRTDLHRRGVGTQQLPRTFRCDVEGVLLAARWMVDGEIQGVEVELLGLHFGTFGQLPAHGDERIGDMFGQNRDRMPRAGGLPSGGQRDVDALGHQDCGIALGPQHDEPVVEELLSRRACHVDTLAGLRALRLGQRPQCLARQRQRRLVTEVFGLGAGQCVEIGGQAEGMVGRADSLRQRLLRQVWDQLGLVTHATQLLEVGSGINASADHR